MRWHGPCSGRRQPMNTRILFALALAAPLAAACTESTVEDEFLVDDVMEVDDAKADLGGTYTYYQVEGDTRRCATPFCGGVFYKRANATTTRCIDGKLAERCYAASADWTRLGLGESGTDKAVGALYARKLVVRATIGRKNWGPDLGVFGELRPTEAWIGQGPNPPTGPFAKVELSGVRCSTTPCPLFREKKLNSSASANLAELGWDASDATEELVGFAQGDMLDNKIIIAGDRYTVTGPGGRMAARTVNQFYTRATDSRTCWVGGCSGSLCDNEPGRVSTCQFRPQDACYGQTSTCEQQADGNCGWTPTPELEACLANPPQI